MSEIIADPLFQQSISVFLSGTATGQFILGAVGSCITAAVGFGVAEAGRRRSQRADLIAVNGASEKILMDVFTEARKSYKMHQVDNEILLDAVSSRLNNLLDEPETVAHLIRSALVDGELDYQSLSERIVHVENVVTNIDLDWEPCVRAFHGAFRQQVHERLEPHTLQERYQYEATEAILARTAEFERILKWLVDNWKNPEKPLRPRQGAGRLYDFPLLPTGHVPSDAELEQIEWIIEAGASPAVLVGMGGSGKSVLANAFGRSAYAQFRFPDGIFWVNVGQEPMSSLPGKIAQIAVSLGAAGDPRGDLATAASMLEDGAQTHSALLILDNVWEVNHITGVAGAIAGTQCRMLLTTRIPTITTALGVVPHPVGPLSLDVARPFLAAIAGVVADELPREVNEVVAECGGIRFALALCAAQRRAGTAWDVILDLLRDQDLSDLAAEFGDGYEYSNVLRSLRASVEHLRLTLTRDLHDETEADKLVQLFLDLAVFDPVQFPESTVVKFWACRSNFKLSRLRQHVTRLSTLGLMQSSIVQPTRQLSIHDLFHGLLCHERRANLVELHADLIDASNPQRAPWHTIKDDMYLYDHLLFHLSRANRTDEIRSLFGGDEWMIARYLQNEFIYDGFLADLDIAWTQHAYPELLDQQENGLELVALAQIIHYALIASAVNTRSGNHVPEVVARAVELGVWTPEQALSAASRMPHTFKQLHLLELLVTLDQVQSAEEVLDRVVSRAFDAVMKDENPFSCFQHLTAFADRTTGPRREAMNLMALEAALAIKEPTRRARALAAVAVRFEIEQQDEILSQALDAAIIIPNAYGRATALAELATIVNEDMLPRAFGAALAIQDIHYRSNAIASFASRLKDDSLQRALDAAIEILEKSSDAVALTALAGRLEGEELSRALACIMRIKSHVARSIFLQNFAGNLQGKERKRIQAQALWATTSEPDPFARFWRFIGLVPELEGTHKRLAIAEAHRAAMGIRSPLNHAWALGKVADFLDEGAREQSLEFAFGTSLTIKDARLRLDLISYLAGKLDGKLFSLALDAMCETNDTQRLATALNELADRLDGENRNQVLARACAAVYTIIDPGSRCIALAALSDRVEGDKRSRLLSEALELALTTPLPSGLENELDQQLLEPTKSGRHLLEALADKLGPELIAHAISFGGDVDHKAGRSKALASLAHRIDGPRRDELLSNAVEAASLVRDGGTRSNLFAMIGSQFRGERRSTMLRAAVDAASSVAEPHSRFYSLLALIDILENGARQECLFLAVDAAAAIPGGFVKALALSSLASYVPAELEPITFSSGTVIDTDSLIVSTILKTTDGLAGEALLHAWASTMTTKAVLLRGMGLRIIARRLEGDDLGRALDIAIAQTDERVQSEALAALAPILDTESLGRVVEIADHIEDEGSRVSLLVALADKISEHERESVLTRAIIATSAIDHIESRAHAFALLASCLSSTYRPLVLADALRNMCRETSIEVLLELLAQPEWYALPVTVGVAEAIATSIDDICMTWRWQ